MSRWTGLARFQSKSRDLLQFQKEAIEPHFVIWSGIESGCATATPIEVVDLTDLAAPVSVLPATDDPCDLCELFPHEALHLVLDRHEREESFTRCECCLRRMRAWLVRRA